MSTALTVLGQAALAKGGIGTGSKLFQVKPSTLELVQKMSRQKDAKPGMIRDTATNEHFSSMRLVMLFVPVEQQQLFEKGKFNKESKICFSLDGITPHDFVKDPKALSCATCKFNAKVTKNWEKWRTTGKNPADVPPCKNYYHLVVAERSTQMPYYFNIKNKSVQEFEREMKNVARLLARMEANARMQNKAIKAENDALLAQGTTGTIEGDDLGRGTGITPLKPYVPSPNIFDISFKIGVTDTADGNFMLTFGDFAVMNEADRAEFGQIYLDFLNRKAMGQVVSQEAVEAEMEAAVAASEEDQVKAALTNPAVTIPTGPITGVVVGKDEVITI